MPVALDNEREYRLAENDVIAWLREQPLDLRELNATHRRDAARRAPGPARHAAAPGRARQAPRGAGLDPRLPRLGRAARRLRPPRRGPGGGARALPATPLHLLGRDTIAERDEAVARLPGPRRPAAASSCATRVAAQGHHAHARVERRLPRARVDAGDARPGRGPLPPHRPARRRHRLVPAGRRHDRRDDGRASSSASAASSPRSPTGARSTATACVDGVVRELRGGKPFRHLRAV